MEGYIHFNVTQEGIHTEAQLKRVSPMDKAVLIRAMMDALKLQGEEREFVLDLAQHDKLMHIAMKRAPKKAPLSETKAAPVDEDLTQDVPQRDPELEDALRTFGALLFGL